MKIKSKDIFVNSEIGKLEILLTHSPDGGIGKIIPSKFKDWLYDDTVELQRMQKEYDEYRKILLYFLDIDKAKELEKWEKENPGKRDAFIPGNKSYISSDKVIEIEELLYKLLERSELKQRIVSSICSIEGCPMPIEEKLLDLDPVNLAKTLISGVIKVNKTEDFIFPPIPNLVFTRDIGITIKDSILLSKTAKKARKRESILAKYIFYYLILPNEPNKVLEISEATDFFLQDDNSQDELKVTLEGGDVMMIGDNHLIVGCSERTSPAAVDKLIHTIFKRQYLGIEYISVIKIQEDRSQMHIDTIFTQISKGNWILHPKFSEKKRHLRNEKEKDYTSFLRKNTKHEAQKAVHIMQFKKAKHDHYSPEKDYYDKNSESLKGLEDFLISVSARDFRIKPEDVKIVYSADGVYPYSEREQWTDSCNLLALKEGVVIGYDRNHLTTEAFKTKLNYNVLKSSELIERLRNGLDPNQIQHTLIVLPSTELSRARGGSHCMSFPLNRQNVKL